MLLYDALILEITWFAKSYFWNYNSLKSNPASKDGFNLYEICFYCFVMTLSLKSYHPEDKRLYILVSNGYMSV